MPDVSDLPARLHAIADEVAAALADKPGPATPAVPPAPPRPRVTPLDDGRLQLDTDPDAVADRWRWRDELDTDPATQVKDVTTTPRTVRSRMKPGARGRRYSVSAGNAAGWSEWSEPVDVPAAGEGEQKPDQPEPQPAGRGRVPTDVLPVLKTWTITTTTGKPGSPTNLYPAQLGDGAGHIPGVFYVRDDGGVMFHATVDGVTTKNSKRCRVEGRQMADGRWTKAAWSGADPHALDAELWISTAGLTKRKRVSGLQIHDGGDDVLQVVADAELGLAVLTDDGKTVHVLDAAYRDEQRCTVRIETGRNRRKSGGKTVADVVVTYRSGDVSKTVTIEKVGTSWYYKAGCYLQASMAEHGEPATAYGEVVIYRLDATGKLTST